MTDILCSTSVNGVGCTFLDWSILYLKGESKFFHRKRGWIDLVDDPLKEKNAHGHWKNHPMGFSETCEYVNFIQKNSNFVNLYPTLMSWPDVAQRLNFSLADIDKDKWQKLIDYRNQDYNQILHWLNDRDAKIVFVSTNKSLPLYVNTQRYTDSDELRQSHDRLFFQDSVNKWKTLGLTNIWDTRERLALCTRPFEILEENVDLSIDHYWLDCQELWFNGDKKIPLILDWLEIKIDPIRYELWLNVYHKWRNLQANTVSFAFSCQHIVQCIINGWSYPINLTFEQEVTVQHCLIYQHNLNLKTWNLDKFPNNTKDLHTLIEPNIHPLA